MYGNFNQGERLLTFKAKNIFGAILILVSLPIGYLFFWPVGISPEVWTPEKNPAGMFPFERNNRLADARLIELDGYGPEGSAIADNGFIFSGLSDGRIIAIDPKTNDFTDILNTGGRPLAMQFAREIITGVQSDLIICDAPLGLLAFTHTGELKTLTNEVDGTPIRFADDLDISSDGVVWFSDASTRHGIHDMVYEGMETPAAGRLLTYDFKTGKTEIVLDGLHFANGVALAEDESFVLIAETYRYRVQKYWISGPKAGQTEIFAENLPGYPDNITRAPDGGFWIALVNGRDKTLDTLMPSSFMRKLVFRIMKFIEFEPLWEETWALYLDQNGKVVHALDARHSDIYAVTNVKEKNGLLFLSSLQNNALGIIPSPTSP